MSPITAKMIPSAALMKASGLWFHSFPRLRASRRGHGGNSEYGLNTPFGGPLCISHSRAFSCLMSRLTNFWAAFSMVGEPNHKRRDLPVPAQAEATDV